MKVALIYDYLYTYGGGERVLELFHEIYPDAPIYTLLFTPKNLPSSFKEMQIIESNFKKLPFRKKFFKLYVPFMPLFIESFDFSEYDLVISISAGFAKGALTPISTCHVSYILTVPRFLWGYETSTQYKHKKNIALPLVNNYLRMWDKAASERVDYFISNSNTVKERIKKVYKYNSQVIYSPVDEEEFSLSTIKREEFYLIVSRLEKYKRIDLAIKACKRMGKKLVIIGDGPQRERLEKISTDSIEFLGKVPDDILLKYYRSTKAVIFAGADDLGLVPIESQMCGTPVIAFGKDGVLETIEDGISGVLFSEQTTESLTDAIKRFESINFNREVVRANALKFSKSSIKVELKQFVHDAYQLYQKQYKI